MQFGECLFRIFRIINFKMEIFLRGFIEHFCEIHHEKREWYRRLFYIVCVCSRFSIDWNRNQVVYLCNLLLRMHWKGISGRHRCRQSKEIEMWMELFLIKVFDIMRVTNARTHCISWRTDKYVEQLMPIIKKAALHRRRERKKWNWESEK